MFQVINITNNPRMLYCQLCTHEHSKTDIDKYMTNTTGQINVFQCDRCFYIENPVTIYNFDEPCPICFEECNNKYVYNKCVHWICENCYHNEKIKKSECYLCKTQSNAIILPSNNLCQRYQSECFDNSTSIETKDNKYDYFINLDPGVQKCFKQLYAQINDTIGSALKIRLNNNVLYLLCMEYHKFLKLLIENDNNNNIDKLSPSYYIDQIWHEHILNISNYVTVCNIMCGYLIHHYPENSFLINRPLYSKRFDQTIALYQKNYGNINPILFEIWKPLEIYYDNIPRKKYNLTIFVKLLSGPTITVTVDNNASILDIKKIIAQKCNYSEICCNLLWCGQQLQDDQIVTEYGIRDQSTLHHVRRLSGC